jgi:hypothetical protein
LFGAEFFDFMSFNKLNENLGDNYIKVRTKRRQDICFVNVDLEIESTDDLQYLINEFGENVDVLYHDRLASGNDFVSLEISSNLEKKENYGEADNTVYALCDLIENLPLKLRNIWNKSIKRNFDIGFESGNTEQTFETTIQTKTLKRLAKIGGSVSITIYPVLNYIIKQKED